MACPSNTSCKETPQVCASMHTTSTDPFLFLNPTQREPYRSTFLEKWFSSSPQHPTDLAELMGVEPWQRYNAHDDAIIKINLCDIRTWQSSLFRVLEQEHILLCPHSDFQPWHIRNASICPKPLMESISPACDRLETPCLTLMAESGLDHTRRTFSLAQYTNS